jgi:hypothetical protein
MLAGGTYDFGTDNIPWSETRVYLNPILLRRTNILYSNLNSTSTLKKGSYRMTPANSSMTGISLITRIWTLASRILILVTLPRTTLPSLGSNEVGVADWDCRVTERMEGPFFEGRAWTGPRMVAWRVLRSEGRCVPGPGLYCFEGARGWPGRAIVGRGGFCEDVIVVESGYKTVKIRCKGEFPRNSGKRVKSP